MPRSRPAPADQRLTKQRARSSQDKATRRAQLLAAAAALLADTPYEQLTLSAVARAAGLSKASAYTYFPTKESLFLALLTERLEAWRDRFVERLSPRSRSPRAVARAIAHTFAEDPGLRELLARLHSTLEANVPDDEVRAFKWFTAGLMTGLAVYVDRACPGLRGGQAQHLFLLVHSFVIGLGMACTQTPNVVRAMALEPALAQAFAFDFETELARVIELVLRGWLAENARSPS
ncbi:MAG: TetR family transcriptional regulator [Gammaproteobacteria bacterium]|nr:TetR family transcriptional regulator [Gammaproteobacteria bacterium]MCP5199706.1 TetR family transcriptional regulator [Gammaproteobacteria bacterium]